MLELLDETLVCLELLVEERLVPSSLITVEARVVVVDSVSDEEESLPEPPLPLSLLPHEIMVRLKRSTNKMCKILFIFSSTLVSVEITWGLLRWNVGVFI